MEEPPLYDVLSNMSDVACLKNREFHQHPIDNGVSGVVFWNTEIQYLPESTEIQYLLLKSNYIIKFTMICVNLDIYTVK